MKKILGIIIGITGLLGMIGSSIITRFWQITIVVMVILKLANAINVPWFAGIFEAGAISTGLWILAGGLFFVSISTISAIAGAVLLEDKK